MEIKIFESPKFGAIRTAGTAENPTFCLVDICNVLELTNTSQVRARLDNGVISNEVITDKLNRPQRAVFINEDGLYDVILDSRKPEARMFRKWVTSEVLPAIRKDGGYIYATTEDSPEEIMAKALIIAQATLSRVEKEKELAIAQRDEAILTKAYISDKKAATAMQTASVLSRENKRLKIEVDRSKDYATITTVERFTKKRYRWQELRNYCNAHELDMPKIDDKRYGKVRTYPFEAWMNVYGVDLRTIL